MKTTVGCSSCIGKVVGEHLECSPCGTVTCPHGGIAWMALVWPEVLLSRLPKALDYNCFFGVVRAVVFSEGAEPQRLWAVMGRFQVKAIRLSHSRPA